SQGIKLGDDFFLDSVAGSGVGRLDDRARRGHRDRQHHGCLLRPDRRPDSVPYGWADFCRRYAGECDSGPLAPLDINLTPKTMKEIGRVSQWVNAHIKPVSDMEHWGVIDRWDYPSDGKG